MHTNHLDRLDELADKGYSLRQIERDLKNGGCNVSHETVRTHLKRYGMYPDWIQKRNNFELSEKRDDVKEEDMIKSKLEKLVSILSARVYSLLPDEELPVQRAIKYIMPRRNIRKSYEAILEVLTRYETALKLGKRLGLEELSNGLSISRSNVRYVLMALKLKPMYGTRKKLTSSLRQEIYEAQQSGFDRNEIAYLLDIDPRTVDKALLKAGH